MGAAPTRGWSPSIDQRGSQLRLGQRRGKGVELGVDHSTWSSPIGARPLRAKDIKTRRHGPSPPLLEVLGVADEILQTVGRRVKGCLTHRGSVSLARVRKSAT